MLQPHVFASWLNTFENIQITRIYNQFNDMPAIFYTPTTQQRKSAIHFIDECINVKILRDNIFYCINYNRECIIVRPGLY